MDGNTARKLGLFGVGGVIGGFIGYLIAEIIIYQLDMDVMEENEWTLEFQATKELFTPDPPAHKEDYAKYSKNEKAALKELVKEYLPDSQDPRIITLDEYTLHGPHEYAKETVTYYEDDGQFADSNEDPIPNPQDIFGANIHLHFGEDSEDPDVVYVRHEKQSTDYEIIRVHGSYSVAVLGIIPKEEKPKPKRSRRKVTKIDEDDNEEE